MNFTQNEIEFWVFIVVLIFVASLLGTKCPTKLRIQWHCQTRHHRAQQPPSSSIELCLYSEKTGGRR